jgi:hypothetical protein
MVLYMAVPVSISMQTIVDIIETFGKLGLDKVEG